MALYVWQRTITDGEGNVVPGAEITVQDQSSAELVQLYSDVDGNEGIGNPINADEDGFVRFYTGFGVYKITASSGESQRIWEDVRLGTTGDDLYVSGDIRRFGAVFGSTDATATRQAIQAAIDSGEEVFIPAGTWLIDEAIQWKSNTHIRGAGIGNTIIKMDDQAHEDINGLEPNLKDGSVINWSLSGFTVDGNFSRPTVSGVGSKRPGSSCIATMGARHGRIVNIKVTGAVLHGLDVCNGGEIDGNHYYVAPANRASDYYPDNESDQIFIDEVYAEDCGDDAITGHYAKNIHVGRVYVSSTGGRHGNPDASNCFEIDDGCRRWFIESVVAEGGNIGFVSKTHEPEPSPSDIQVSRVHATGCRLGVLINGRALDFDSGARIQIGSITVRSPADVNGGREPPSDVPIGGVRVSVDANHVTIGQIIAEAEGTEEFEMSAAVAVVNAASQVNIGSIVAVNWPYNNEDDTTIGGVTITSSTSRVMVGSINLKDCGRRGVVVTGDTGCMIGMVNAVLTSSIDNSVGVRFLVDPDGSSNFIAGVSASGYTAETLYG